MSAEFSSNVPDVERTIRNRFVRVYAALTIVIIIGAVFVVLAVRDRNRAADGEDQLWRPGQIAAVEVLTAVVDQETGVRGFVITDDEKFLEPYTAGRQRSAQTLEALRVLFRDEASIRSLVDNVATKLSTWQTQVESCRSRRPESTSAPPASSSAAEAERPPSTSCERHSPTCRRRSIVAGPTAMIRVPVRSRRSSSRPSSPA